MKLLYNKVQEFYLLIIKNYNMNQFTQFNGIVMTIKDYFELDLK